MLTPLKVIIAATVGAVLWSGCSTRSITYGNATYTSTQFLRKENFKSLTLTNSNGEAVTIEGYSADGGAEFGALVGEAIKHAK